MDSFEHKYLKAYRPMKTPDENAWILILHGKKILMKSEDNKLVIPTITDIEDIINDDTSMEYMGGYDGTDCFCVRLNHEAEGLPVNLEWIDLMQITKRSGDADLFMLAGTANHFLHWISLHQYCGRCGAKMIDKSDERAKLCPSCSNLVYPRISPAVITAVLRGDQILLAHNSNFRDGLYSLIAGYVEPGESLELCVEREILEEVGIKVKNIRYFKSQPWPFPDALMMAFTAEYESGEIEVDNFEITDASWYDVDNLPEIPSTDSVAGKIIRWFRDEYK